MSEIIKISGHISSFSNNFRGNLWNFSRYLPLDSCCQIPVWSDMMSYHNILITTRWCFKVKYSNVRAILCKCLIRHAQTLCPACLFQALHNRSWINNVYLSSKWSRVCTEYYWYIGMWILCQMSSRNSGLERCHKHEYHGEKTAKWTSTLKYMNYTFERQQETANEKKNVTE